MDERRSRESEFDPLKTAPLPWNGEDRRAVPQIPLHFLQVMREIVAEGLNRIDGKLEKHIESEEGFWVTVNQKIDDNAQASRERHKERIELLDAIGKDQEKIKSAFLRHENGEHDFAGHHDDHLSRFKAGRWWRDTFSTGFRNLVLVAFSVVGTFIFMAAWESFKASLK